MRFIRIHGRVVPIKDDRKTQKVAAVGVGATGAVIAADAARTDIVRQGVKQTLVRKRFAIQPMMLMQKKLGFGTHIQAIRGGKKAGHIFFNHKAGEGSIDWLGVKKEFRGKGISKTLAKEAAIDLKASGVKVLSSHVVHPRSTKLLSGSAKSSYWRVYRTTKKTGLSHMEQISKTTALKKVAHLKDKGIGSTIFRDTILPNNLRRAAKPFKSAAIKGRLALGLGVLGAGAWLGYKAFSKPKEK